MVTKPLCSLVATSDICDALDPFSADDEVFRFTQLVSFDDMRGVCGHILEGQHYGFEALSLAIMEIAPGSGPPLHTHTCQEAHIVLDGIAAYVLGDQRFTVAGPYVVKIPTGVLHTFLNMGNQPFRLIAVFAHKQVCWTDQGPNPLLEV